MEELRAYLQRRDGLLVITTVLRDGDHLLDSYGYPLAATPERVELLGWPDSSARVYRSEGGKELLVPEA